MSAVLLLPLLWSATELDQAATAIVSELSLSSLDGFTITDDVAVSVAVEGELGRVLGGLVLARLVALGAKSAFLSQDDDSAAILAGAEWRLAIRGETRENVITLWAEVRHVDRGLWATRPDVPILATARHRMRGPLVDLPPPSTVTELPAEIVRLRGPALRIRTLSEPVLALAACRISRRDVDDLVVLTQRRVLLLSFSKGRLATIGTHDLSNVRRHRTPARDPVGRAVCTKRGVDIGHTGLAYGVSLRTIRLVERGPLPGIPIGRGLYAASQGTNVITVRDKKGVVTSPPLFDALAFEDAVWGVTTEYELVELTPKLETKKVIGKSGAGPAVFEHGDVRHFVTTSSTRDEQVRLLSDERGVSIDGAVHATVVGTLRGEGLELIAAARVGASTNLMLVELEVP